MPTASASSASASPRCKEAVCRSTSSWSLPVVRSLAGADACRGALEALGYEYLGEFGIPGRRYLRKGGDERTHQVHIFAADDRENIVRHLAVRDYLRTHPAAREAYGALKRELAARGPGGGGGLKKPLTLGGPGPLRPPPPLSSLMRPSFPCRSLQGSCRALLSCLPLRGRCRGIRSSLRCRDGGSTFRVFHSSSCLPLWGSCCALFLLPPSQRGCRAFFPCLPLQGSCRALFPCLPLRGRCRVFSLVSHFEGGVALFHRPPSQREVPRRGGRSKKLAAKIFRRKRFAAKLPHGIYFALQNKFVNFKMTSARRVSLRCVSRGRARACTGISPQWEIPCEQMAKSPPGSLQESICSHSICAYLHLLFNQDKKARGRDHYLKS